MPLPIIITSLSIAIEELTLTIAQANHKPPLNDILGDFQTLIFKITFKCKLVKATFGLRRGQSSVIATTLMALEYELESVKPLLDRRALGKD